MARIVTIIIACLLVCSCATVRPAILEHQQEVDRTQARIDYLVGRVDAATESVDAIRERANGITGDIEEVIRLFDEYQQRVEQLLRYYKELRDTVTPAEEADIYTPAHSYLFDYTEIYRNGAIPERYQGSTVTGHTAIMEDKWRADMIIFNGYCTI